MFGVAARNRALFTAAATHTAFTRPVAGYRGSFIRAVKGSAVTMAPQQKRKQSSLPAGYKEDHSKGPMLRFEENLPRLPVPTLEETSKRYLKSVRALLSDAEYQRTKKAVEEFISPNGLGPELQKRLEARAGQPKIKNWLSEWWNQAAYLAYRDPIVPYVSYFYSHRDDRKRRDPVKRAAAISFAVLDFAKQVNEGTLEPEYMKKLPIAMSSFEYMFNCCRIPMKPADEPKKYDYKQNAHILVIRKNSFYKLPYEVNGRQLNVAELEEQFRRIYTSAEKGPAVGVMTTENRDNWTDMRERLIKTNPSNEAALEQIQAASFVVCLDDASPITLHERARQYWHGDGSNRWFDKPLQFIVNENGTSGFNGEHSMMDGTPTHRLNDYLNMCIFNNKLDFDTTEVRSDLPPPTPIKFQLSTENLEDISTAASNHVKLMSQHDLRVEAYQGYGKGMMKKFKCSPDAYVQMIIQLAYYKFYGKNRPTYESAATRRFQEGRTETCRTVSEESVAFCTAMQHPLSTAEECRDLFLKAINGHVAYISDASDGKGVDRHLFGLKKLLKEGEDVPELYKDPAYTYSSTWFISSSQLSSEYYNGYGWSQVVDDGWGIAYMINENSVQFNIVSKHLGCERMAFFLNEAAGDIRDMMNATMPKDKAKL